MKRRTLAAPLAILVLAATACGSSGMGEVADDDAWMDPPALATDPLPDLDLDLLQADTAAGTVDATPATGTTYTGPVTDDLFIGISLAEESDAGGVQKAFVYLCDGEVDEYLSGEIGSETTTIERDGVTVEMSFDDDAVLGAVTFEGEAPISFTAEEATGSAGLYMGEFSFEDVDYLPMWIALADGDQRGQASWMCCSADGKCYVCEWTTAETPGVTTDPVVYAKETDPWWTRWFGIRLN